jgi:hypothetical protein
MGDHGVSSKYGAALVHVAIAVATLLASDPAIAQTCTGHLLRFYNILAWSDGFTQYYGPWVD